MQQPRRFAEMRSNHASRRQSMSGMLRQRIQTVRIANKRTGNSFCHSKSPIGCLLGTTDTATDGDGIIAGYIDFRVLKGEKVGIADRLYHYLGNMTDNISCCVFRHEQCDFTGTGSQRRLRAKQSGSFHTDTARKNSNMPLRSFMTQGCAPRPGNIFLRNKDGRSDKIRFCHG